MLRLPLGNSFALDNVEGRLHVMPHDICCPEAMVVEGRNSALTRNAASETGPSSKRGEVEEGESVSVKEKCQGRAEGLAPDCSDKLS